MNSVMFSNLLLDKYNFFKLVKGDIFEDCLDALDKDLVRVGPMLLKFKFNSIKDDNGESDRREVMLFLDNESTSKDCDSSLAHWRLKLVRGG